MKMLKHVTSKLTPNAEFRCHEGTRLCLFITNYMLQSYVLSHIVIYNEIERFICS